ncbi:CBASS cGAMP-activated phospholipase [Corallococcus carmarthensis]|uniref:Patatin n=1 Tax=Corallococcus carmarthensis TaxID=2316728 RepID=A0A3A8KT78_9BACT|nr:CBASS cGAMP-activated phospholipase [Corallococcus carmarthensis]NOK15825.1 patatin-like phospholipase family protein [Corallococcus carmarthensis]RKH07451.1 patatin [Corallococcus carmarthensis]
MSRFRILSLDGGGIRGAFSASVLATLEKETGRACVDHFDLITGTSTGGIIALGLALGLPASTIRDFYRDKGLDIFPGTGLVQRTSLTLRQLFAPKRSHEALKAALRSVFNDMRLGEARCRLVIPTYDAVGGRIFLLKTAHHARFTGEYKASAVDCALATSAAPTYFAAAAFADHPGASYVDGGVWANCPIMVGVAEAVHFLEIPLDQIDVLSIGTLGEPFSVSPSRRRAGILGWNKALIDILMRGQAEAAQAHAQLLTGRNVHRIDQVVSPGRFSLDDARAIDDLIALGHGEGMKEAHLASVRQRFLNGVHAESFVPNHRL